MAETLQVLLRKENHEDVPMRDVFDGLINYDLFEAFPGVFEYFSLDLDEDDFFDGAADPDRMRDFAASFNRSIDQGLDDAFDQVRRHMEEHGLKKLSETDSELVLWKLCKTLCPRTGGFVYGNSLLYEDKYSSWNTYLLKEDVEEVAEHPENFFVITCYYH